jgi:hypothetical protein
LYSPLQPNIPSCAEKVYSPEYLPVSCCRESRRFPGADGEEDGEGAEASEGWRAWVYVPLVALGDVGRVTGGAGWERKARWA